MLFFVNLPRKINSKRPFRKLLLTITQMTNRLHILLLSLLLPLFASAQETVAADVAAMENDTPRVAFVTCSPGEEIHRLYGHTALRLTNDSSDWAVNFGWFSFNTPNFVMKFILGLTDYSMAYQTMPIFIADLVHDDMGVREQVLNLSPDEAREVAAAMRRTLESEGYDRRDFQFGMGPDGHPRQETVLGARWTYRYNFLYDNCTTRAVKAIEDALAAHGEQLVYPTLAKNEITTQREMIHEFTRQSPWYEFGQDLLLGPEVDEKHTVQELSEGLNFLPTYAENFFAEAQIKGKDGHLRQLVNSTTNLTPFLTAKERKPAFPLTPLAVAGIVLGAALLLTVNQRKADFHAAKTSVATSHQRAWRIWGNAFDFTFMALQGIVGILLVIMVGWSEHPAVGTNWLLLMFNPAYLLGIPARLINHKTDRWFGWAAILMSLCLLLAGLCHLQEFPIAIYPLVLAVLLRASYAVRKNLVTK